MLINFAQRRRARRAPAARAQRPAKRPARPRRPNWTLRDHRGLPGPLRPHARIIRELERAEGGATVSELAAALGISRQLCLYRERVEAVRARQAVNAADLARLRERVILGRPPRALGPGRLPRDS